MKIIISIVIISIFLFSATKPSDANISDYVFSQTTGTFNSIHTTGTYISGSCGSSVFSNLPIGFTFVYNGVPYTAFGLCCNGWISMGASAPTNSTVPLSTGITNNVIVPFAAQLASTVAGNGIYYKTEGSAPNRVLTVEWWLFGFWFNGFDEVCFQVKLHEGTNEIHFVYTTNDELSIRNIQVGLRGASNDDFKNRTTATNWSQTTAGTVNTATCLYSPGITPAAGLTFVWTPLAVGIEKIKSGIPAEYRLFQNVPNPFNPVTEIKYSLPENAFVRLTVYDLLGKEIKNLVGENQSSGLYTVSWDASSVPSGIYFYRLETNNYSEVRKMILIK
jgi:hypothetical protein